MEQTMRWFGPSDPVSLSDIRQAGCTGVVTALHHLRPGDVWSVEEIMKRMNVIEDAGLTWTVVESLPVHEDIKKRAGNFEHWITNYQQSLRNLSSCGVKVVTYNFMPVLDWVRTDLSFRLPDGSTALRFDRHAFIAMDLFMLQRPGASQDYMLEEKQAARILFDAMSDDEKRSLYKNILAGLPGSEEHFTENDIVGVLQGYKSIDASRLRTNLIEFLQAIIPVAEATGIRMAIHPDDPPYPVLGLPRVVSTERDVDALLKAVPSLSNGLCFCTGSFGVREENDVPGMINRFGEHIYFLHLRNTRTDTDGSFYEADHLAGDTDMARVVKEIVHLMRRTQRAIPMRPDHGHQILDDLSKKTNPGYSAIGRLKGLAELRGLELGISRFT